MAGGAKNDDVWAWLLAGVMAGLAGPWLSRPRRQRIVETQVEFGVRLVVTSLSLFVVLATTLTLVRAILLAVTLRGHRVSRHAFRDLARAIPPMVVHRHGLSRPAARRGTSRHPPLARNRRFLGRVRLLGATTSHRRHHRTDPPSPSSDPFINAVESTRTVSTATAAIDLVTIDTLVTGVLACLVILNAAGRIRVNTAVLTLVLAASTLSAYSGFLSAVFESRYSVLFYLGLVFPIAYTFLANSKELNGAGSRRRTRIPSAVSLALALLTASLAGVAANRLDESSAALGRILFGPPLVAMLVAAAVVAMSTRSVGEVTIP